MGAIGYAPKNNAVQALNSKSLAGGDWALDFADTDKSVPLLSNMVFLRFYQESADGHPYLYRVIDSPNQQAQDDINLPAVMQFIGERLPDNLQLIVGLEHKPEHKLDREIQLGEPYKLLQQSEFEAVSAFVDPLLGKMYDSLLSKDSPLCRDQRQA